MRSTLPTWFVAVSFGLPGSLALAEELPEHFVSSDACTSRPCTCDDGPLLELFLHDQTAARDAWASVQADIQGGSGPTTPGQAIALFQSRFAGDTRIADQFRSCAGYDPSVNKLTKIAGVSGLGQARLDPCFCDAFCADIVASTVSHELMHVPTIIAGVVSRGDFLVGCTIGVLSGPICTSIMPMTLATSEVLSHNAGITVLNSGVDRVRALDPDGDGPRTRCTWESLTPQTASARPDVPADVVGRVRTLFDRIVHGSEP